MPVHFDAETVQTFYVGPASCGVPGTAAGLELALERFGSVPLAELVGPGDPRSPARAPRSTPSRPTSSTSSRRSTSGCRARASCTRRRGGTLREGEVFRFPELAEALERFGAEGAEPFYRGEVAAALSEFVGARAAARSAPTDLAAYEAIERRADPGRRSAAPRC